MSDNHRALYVVDFRDEVMLMITDGHHRQHLCHLFLTTDKEMTSVLIKTCYENILLLHPIYPVTVQIKSCYSTRYIMLQY